MNKEFYKSKTLWVNLIAFIALGAQMIFGFAIDAETQVGLLAIINLILRLITNAGLVF